MESQTSVEDPPPPPKEMFTKGAQTSIEVVPEEKEVVQVGNFLLLSYPWYNSTVNYTGTQSLLKYYLIRWLKLGANFD